MPTKLLTSNSKRELYNSFSIWQSREAAIGILSCLYIVIGLTPIGLTYPIVITIYFACFYKRRKNEKLIKLLYNDQLPLINTQGKVFIIILNIISVYLFFNQITEVMRGETV